VIELVAPFPRSELLSVWEWGQAFRERMFDDASLPSLDAFIADWQAQESAGRNSWAVMRGGEIGGCFISTRLAPATAELHLLFKKSFWGRATTLPALRVVCEALFATGVDKIESTAPADSRAVLALTKAVGATHRLLPGQTSRNGRPVDVIGIALHRDAFLVKAGA